MRAIVLLFFLASCVGSNQSSLTKAVIVTGDEKLKVSAPGGFCVDQSMTTKSDDTITLFIIDCLAVETAIGNEFFRRPVSVIFTATVIGSVTNDLQSIEQMRAFLTSDSGRIHLSRSGKNSNLKLIKVEETDGILLFLIEQRSNNSDFIQSDYFWRAILISKGQIISLTASNFSSQPNIKNKLRKLILEFSRTILHANK